MLSQHAKTGIRQVDTVIYHNVLNASIQTKLAQRSIGLDVGVIKLVLII